MASPDKRTQLVVFSLDGLQYALHLEVVERIVRSVEISPLPKAPESVIGVINVQGRIIPVFNVRRRFHLPERDLNLEDRLILARTRRRSVGLAVDAAWGVIERLQEEITAAEKILPGLEFVEGVTRLEGGMVFIHDLEKFLSLSEEKALDEAMKPDG